MEKGRGGTKKWQELKGIMQEIFLFQNMLPINAFIKVAYFFLQVWSGNLAQNPSFQKKNGR